MKNILIILTLLISFNFLGNSQVIIKNQTATGRFDSLKIQTGKTKQWFTNGLGSEASWRTSGDSLFLGDVTGEKSLGSIGNTIHFPDTNTIIATKYDLNSTETVSRTIYYALPPTGNDTTGNGSIGNPFRSPLRCVQSIKSNIVGCTITISGSGTGNVPITLELGNEIAKKTAVNGILSFTGTTVNTIVTGMTVSKTASRLFAYTLTKSGLTSTLNQYRGNFVTTNAQTAFYPIASNAVGTNSFEIEYLNNNLATNTQIISFGVTWTNPSNLGNTFDLGFKNCINSSIIFSNINISQGTIQNLNFRDSHSELFFTSVRFDGKGFSLGENTNVYALTQVRFNQCSFIQTGASVDFISIVNNPQTTFARCFVYAPLMTTGAFRIEGVNTVKFNNGLYIYGANVGSAFSSIIGLAIIPISLGIEIRDFVNYINTGPKLEVVYINPNTVTPMFTEFINVTNLLSTLPSYGFKLSIPNLNGALPTNIINGVSSGYIFVDPKNDIHISVLGLYGEYEPKTTQTLTTNTTTSFTVGNTAQNRSITIEYNILRNSQYRKGTLTIMYNGTSAYLSPDVFITDGGADVDAASIAFSVSLSSTNIVLTSTLDATGGNGTMNYTATRMMQ